MSTAHVMSIRLTDRQIAALASEAKRLSVPVAEVIRRWLDERIDRKPPR